jgi:hypothetical protein
VRIAVFGTGPKSEPSKCGTGEPATTPKVVDLFIINIEVKLKICCIAVKDSSYDDVS